MRTRLALAILLPALFLRVSADDLHDRFDRAVKALRSDDASERDRGEAELQSIAKDDPDLVRPLIDDADPEVNVRSKGVLKRLHVLADSPAERRAMDILDRLSVAEGKERENLVDELLSLGEPAGRLLAEELANRALEPVEQPIAIRENGKETDLRTKARNGGLSALWIGAPETRRLSRDFIGRRRGFLAAGPEPGIAFGRHPYPQAPDMRSWLQTATRIPPGSTVTLSAGSGWPTDSSAPCKLVSATEGGRNYEKPVQAEIGGVSVQVSNERFPRYPIARGIDLQQHDGPEFSTEVVEKDRRPGLEIKAVVDCDSVFTCSDLDNFWFVALNKAGEPVAFGPMGPETPDKKSWKAGESLTVFLEHDIPAGTVRLWFGYDWGIEAGQQVVPAPLEIPESGSKANLK